MLLVSTTGPYARYFVDRIEVPRPGLTIQRSARLTASRDTFDYRGDLSSATLSPPSPFSGKATFSEARHQLSGDLAVALPGASPLSLTGPNYEAQIDPSR